MDAFEIRNSFLDFFRAKGHAIVPSAPIVVKNDPTLMFTNAGMNQFKDIFLGNQPAKNQRVADTQKCLRVSGKHNDLEEVGHDTYHHTMFEMLGNWSFGDYFKREAIAYAWEYLTEVVNIDKDKLYVTVFGGDKKDHQGPDMEAYNYWLQHVDESRIIYGSRKDNFWEMGETGPCGPCSEIHIDLRDEEARKQIPGRELVNKDNPQVIEIWNLVFMQYNRLANGELVELPQKHVDTGMGFERLVRVLQGKTSNYDTDIFQPIIQEIAAMSNIAYGREEECDIAMRVIADHLRAVSFAITDGQLPSNNGAGYVIRRVLRRAVRYGVTFLGFDEPFIYKLLPILVSQMQFNYPEIKEQETLVSKVIFEEEKSFLKTISIGIQKFNSCMKISQYELLKSFVHNYIEGGKEQILRFADYVKQYATESTETVEENLAIFADFMKHTPAIAEDIRAFANFLQKNPSMNVDPNILENMIASRPSSDVNFKAFESFICKNPFLRKYLYAYSAYVNPKEAIVSGDFAFELFDTFGFPIDLTCLMAEEKGKRVDMEGFKTRLEEQKNRSRQAAEKANGDWVIVRESEQPTTFMGYNETMLLSCRILRYREVVSKKDKHYEIVLDATPFYAEMGGQVGDTGIIVSENESLNILNTIKENNLIIHITDKLPQIPEAEFTAKVDGLRRQRIANNHSATHLMHAALRQVLGSHVEQKGSLVNDQRLRFDFSHFAKMTPEEILEVEEIVNRKIRENIQNETLVDIPVDEAKALGATALFGEKYGDKVRVVMFDKDFSMELCGGTHVAATGNIGSFKIIGESAIAAGVRRIEAITGEGVEHFLNENLDQLNRIKGIVKGADVVKGVETLAEQNQALKKEVEHLMQEKAHNDAEKMLSKATEHEGCRLVVETLHCSMDQLRSIALMLKQLNENTIAILGAIFEGKPALCLLLPEAFADAKDLDATKVIREVAKEIQGGGGGQKTLCTAGGRNADGLQKAMAMIRERI